MATVGLSKAAACWLAADDIEFPLVAVGLLFVGVIDGDECQLLIWALIGLSKTSSNVGDNETVGFVVGQPFPSASVNELLEAKAVGLDEPAGLSDVDCDPELGLR